MLHARMPCFLAQPHSVACWYIANCSLAASSLAACRFGGRRGTVVATSACSLQLSTRNRVTYNFAVVLAHTSDRRCWPKAEKHMREMNCRGRQGSRVKDLEFWQRDSQTGSSLIGSYPTRGGELIYRRAYVLCVAADGGPNKQAHGLHAPSDLKMMARTWQRGCGAHWHQSPSL